MMCRRTLPINSPGTLRAPLRFVGQRHRPLWMPTIYHVTIDYECLAPWRPVALWIATMGMRGRLRARRVHYVEINPRPHQINCRCVVPKIMELNYEN